MANHPLEGLLAFSLHHHLIERQDVPFCRNLLLDVLKLEAPCAPYLPYEADDDPLPADGDAVPCGPDGKTRSPAASARTRSASATPSARA